LELALSGRVIVVTGANSGVGKEVAAYCAAKGAKKVYMLCRSKDRANAARDEIWAALGKKSPSSSDSSNNLYVVLADVGELAQVRKAVAEIQAQESKIDAIVCNAGVLLNEKKTTSEGNEVTFASHLLVRVYYR
jgi:dehydrogenase/reductase SDR family member 12